MKSQASGINLSAFGATRRPWIAVARGEGAQLQVELAQAAGFDTRTKLSDPTAAVFNAWSAALVDAPKPLCVDVALECNLTQKAGHLWRLTHRDVDFAFYGDAPLTDRIGEFGVRFRAMLAGHALRIGADLLEAAPAASIDLMDFKGQYRDGHVHHGKGAWKADDKTRRPDKLLAVILTELSINPGQGVDKFDSDALDATLCALTALAVARGEKLLRGAELATEVASRCERRANLVEGAMKSTVPPSCVVLAAPYWESISVNMTGQSREI